MAMTPPPEDSRPHWWSLPLELHEQILTQTFYDALNSNDPNPAVILCRILNAIIGTSHQMAHELSHPLMKLAKAITATIKELQDAQRRLVIDGNALGELVTGNPDWSGWCRWEKGWIMCQESECICADLEPMKAAYQAIAHELTRLRYCDVLICLALAMLKGDRDASDESEDEADQASSEEGEEKADQALERKTLKLGE